MQPDLFDSPAAPPQRTNQDRLYDQLVRLGDMIGDGMHHDSDGAWIVKEYKQVCKALGITRPRRSNTSAINVTVATYIDKNRCECGGLFKQSRSGSMRVYCTCCTNKYQLKTRKG